MQGSIFIEVWLTDQDVIQHLPQNVITARNIWWCKNCSFQN